MVRITGYSVHEAHGFEFPAKTIFSNNLKTIDLRAVFYVYLFLAQLSCSKKCAKCTGKCFSEATFS